MCSKQPEACTYGRGGGSGQKLGSPNLFRVHRLQISDQLILCFILLKHSTREGRPRTVHRAGAHPASIPPSRPSFYASPRLERSGPEVFLLVKKPADLIYTSQPRQIPETVP